jgi:hypothetical protein
MNIKRLIGVLLLAVGIAALFYAHFQKGRIEEAAKKANEQIHQGQNLFQGNPIGQAVGSIVGGSMHSKAASEVEKYQNIVMWLTIGGIVVGIIGLGMVIFCGTKKK